MKNQAYIVPAIVGGLCLIISTIIGAYTFYRVHTFDNSLSVTGSARQEIVSDRVKWVAQFQRTPYESDLEGGYAQMSKDLSQVKKFFSEQGFPENQLTISPVLMDMIYKSDQNEPRQYTLRQTVEIDSSNVDQIATLSKNVESLVGKGIIFSTQSLEYTYSKLPDLRVSLLADALKDAKARAEKLAQSSNSQVGVLKSAASGVVQVLPENSQDVSDYGQYDTSSIKKQVMVTVKATFTIK